MIPAPNWHAIAFLGGSTSGVKAGSAQVVERLPVERDFGPHHTTA
jgi:hypothetical protein